MTERGQQSILVTGVAGFIGAAVAQRLLARGERVIGIDNLNDYYDPELKRARLARIRQQRVVDSLHFEFIKLDLADRVAVEALFNTGEIGQVVHLAAQAGVRHSIDHPHPYIDSNIVGFLHIIEGCRHHGVKHLVFASSSSVYGASAPTPFSESDPVNRPVSLYAATKKANELMAHAYAHLYRLPVTGLRIFTVYGPWGRPDMAPMRFARAMLAGEPIDVYNHGRHRRDFTYIDDVARGIVHVLDHPPQADDDPPYRLYNLGSNRPVELLAFIEGLESALGVRADKRMLPMQPGDVSQTYADMSRFIEETGFQPATPLQSGLEQFAQWYVDWSNRS